MKHQPFAAGIVMQVIHFLFPKLIRNDAYRMLRWLPKATLTILAGMFAEFCSKALILSGKPFLTARSR
jgi:hypothetical protein